MANPVQVTLTKNSWTSVATNVTQGMIRLLKRGTKSVLHTYRMTGGVAPTLRSEGAAIAPHVNDFEISSAAPIDVYLWIDDEDGTARRDV